MASTNTDLPDLNTEQTENVDETTEAENAPEAEVAEMESAPATEVEDTTTPADEAVTNVEDQELAEENEPEQAELGEAPVADPETEETPVEETENEGIASEQVNEAEAENVPNGGDAVAENVTDAPDDQETVKAEGDQAAKEPGATPDGKKSDAEAEKDAPVVDMTMQKNVALFEDESMEAKYLSLMIMVEKLRKLPKEKVKHYMAVHKSSDPTVFMEKPIKKKEFENKVWEQCIACGANMQHASKHIYKCHLPAKLRWTDNPKVFSDPVTAAGNLAHWLHLLLWHLGLKKMEDLYKKAYAEKCLPPVIKQPSTGRYNVVRVLSTCLGFEWYKARLGYLTDLTYDHTLLRLLMTLPKDIQKDLASDQSVFGNLPRGRRSSFQSGPSPQKLQNKSPNQNAKKSLTPGLGAKKDGLKKKSVTTSLASKIRNTYTAKKKQQLKQLGPQGLARQRVGRQMVPSLFQLNSALPPGGHPASPGAMYGYGAEQFRRSLSRESLVRPQPRGYAATELALAQARFSASKPKPPKEINYWDDDPIDSFNMDRMQSPPAESYYATPLSRQSNLLPSLAEQRAGMSSSRSKFGASNPQMKPPSIVQLQSGWRPMEERGRDPMMFEQLSPQLPQQYPMGGQFSPAYGSVHPAPAGRGQGNRKKLSKEQRKKQNKPAQMFSHPSMPANSPSQRGGRPSQRGGRPSQRGGMPSQRGGMPSQRGGMPSQRGGPPSQRGGSNAGKRKRKAANSQGPNKRPRVEQDGHQNMPPPSTIPKRGGYGRGQQPMWGVAENAYNAGAGKPGMSYW